MSQASELVDSLKLELKRRGISYAVLAERLGLSESTIKRLFAQGRFSLQRLADVCDAVGLQIADLADLARERQRDTEQLDEAQEKTLVEDPKLLLVAYMLLNDWRVDKILLDYEIDELEMVRLLARLDRLKIIDLLPGNRVRMRLSRRFAWRPNGPIQRFFERQVQSEFFSSRFDRPGELRLVLNGALSEQSIVSLHERLARVAEDFESRVLEDRRDPASARYGTTAVLAIRPWSLGMFEQFKRPGRETPVLRR